MVTPGGTISGKKQMLIHVIKTTVLVSLVSLCFLVCMAFHFLLPL